MTETQTSPTPPFSGDSAHAPVESSTLARSVPAYKDRYERTYQEFHRLQRDIERLTGLLRLVRSQLASLLPVNIAISDPTAVARFTGRVEGTVHTALGTLDCAADLGHIDIGQPKTPSR